jgi:hypothetical protein
MRHQPLAARFVDGPVTSLDHDDLEAGSRAEDRHHADSFRKRGGHQPAQVALRLFGDLDVDHRGFTRPHGDPVVADGHLVGQFLGVLLLLALVAVDARHDQAGRAVAADPIRGRGRRRGPR